MAPVDLNHYGNAEKVLSEILRDHERESFVLATKVGNGIGTLAEWIRPVKEAYVLANNRKFEAVKTGIRGRIFGSSPPDEETPHLETLQAFDDLVAMGKVHYIGCSNFTTEQVIDFMELSKVHDLVSFVTLQDPYSLVNRSIESNKLPLARKYNFTIMAYSTLAQGLLSGRYLDGVPVR